MDQSRDDKKQRSGQPNKLHRELREQQNRRRNGQPSQRDFAKQLSRQLHALERTFNEAKEASQSLQPRNCSNQEGNEVITVDTDSPEQAVPGNGYEADEEAHSTQSPDDTKKRGSDADDQGRGDADTKRSRPMLPK